tara:strand:+ start:980 stop:2284 length:1305 start_codon:yes stop_codon:yes gene_type:complete
MSAALAHKQVHPDHRVIVFNKTGTDRAHNVNAGSLSHEYGSATHTSMFASPLQAVATLAKGFVSRSPTINVDFSSPRSWPHLAVWGIPALYYLAKSDAHPPLCEALKQKQVESIELYSQLQSCGVNIGFGRLRPAPSELAPAEQVGKTRRMKGSEVSLKEPILADNVFASSDQEVVSLPGDITLHAPTFASSFRKHVENAGVEWVEDESAVHPIVEEGIVRAIRLCRGPRATGQENVQEVLEHAVDSVVFAMGSTPHPIGNPWVIPGSGVSVDIPYIYTSESTAPFLSSTLFKDGIFIVPYGNGIRFSTGFILNNELLCEADKLSAARAIVKMSRDVFGDFSDRLQFADESRWRVYVGARPLSPDGMPICGAHPELANASVLTGLGSYGYLARALANDMYRGTLSPYFTASRFGTGLFYRLLKQTARLRNDISK